MLGRLKRQRQPRTLFAKMWHPLLALMLVTFAVHAFLVTATLQLGAEAQTARRLARIADHWASQGTLPAPLGLDPVTVVYPRSDLLPLKLQRLLKPSSRGLFELGNRAHDYFVLARPNVAGAVFYVVEFHSEVKPNETIEHQVFVWYLLGALPFCALLLWLCKRITAHVAAPMHEVGVQVMARSPGSLELLALPTGSSVELDALISQINDALVRTVELLERERTFTDFVSHELRTPAAIVQSALERVEAFATSDQSAPLGRAKRGLRDLNVLIDTFLQLSSDVSRAPKTPATVVDAEWIRSLFQHITHGQQARALTVMGKTPLVLEAPDTMLQVLVGNLLKNALFHGGPEAIEVYLGSRLLEVRNSLAAEASTKGYGLGCQIARRICERFGWEFNLVIGTEVAVAQVKVRAAMLRQRV